MMHRLSMAARSLLARRRRTALTFTALTVALSFLTLLLSLSQGLRLALERQAATSFLAGEVILSPPVRTSTLPVVKYFEQDGPETLDEPFLEELRSRPGIRTVVPQLRFPVPSTARASIAGSSFEIDLPLFAVDDTFFVGQFGEPAVEGDAIPVIVSRRLLDIYNLGIAPTADLPRLSENGLDGLTFEVELGYSSFLQTKPLGRSVRTEARITGFTDQPTLMGATMRRSDAESLLRELEPSLGFPPTYRTVLVFAEGEARAEALAEELRAGGYRASTLATALSGIRGTTGIVTAVLGFVALIVLLLAFLAMATTMTTVVMERTPEIGILRAVGARRSDILRRFLLESALLGLASAAVGVLLGAGAAVLLSRVIDRFVPVSMLEGTIISLSPAILLLPFLLGAATAILATLAPAWRAAKMMPVDALREREV